MAESTKFWLNRAPIKVGWLGFEWRGWKREIRMAFDEGVERGLLDRGYELVFEQDAGLPQSTAAAGIESYRRLVDAGCLAVVGANYSDAALALTDVVNASEVPLISMCGSDRFNGPYCFRVGNGDTGAEPTLIVHWLLRQGFRRVALALPWSPIGEEYFSHFRQECRRFGLQIAATEPITNAFETEDLAAAFGRLRDAGPDALVWLGYGGLVVAGTVRSALDAIRWDPPRIMTTAFMQYLWGFDKVEGWVGIDQYCPENPQMQQFIRAFRERYDEDPGMWPNALPMLAYDMARVVVEGLHRAPILTGPGVRAGIERIRFLPAATGGPNTHLAGGPHDHQLFKGDWLHYGAVRGGQLEFVGLFEPCEQ